MVSTTTRRRLLDDMAVDLPDGVHGSVAIEHFDVEAFSIENMRLSRDRRECRPGRYTRLMRDGLLWMSDTTAERRDHLGAALQIDGRGGRVLIGGLGLGMILRVALLTPDVTHVDVVELDEHVIALVGPAYEQLAAEHSSKTLTIHHDDMLKIRWDRNSSWSVAWFDIWPTLGTENLEAMARLRRSYGRRSEWCECWGRELILRERARGRWS